MVIGPISPNPPGAIDENVEPVGLAPKRGEKPFDLPLISYIADMRFNVRKALRDGGQAIRATSTNEFAI